MGGRRGAMPPPRDSQRWLRRRAVAAVWRRLRAPFALPRRLPGHECSRHWEAIDVDQAGCRLCGRVHFCSRLREDVAGPGRLPNEDCDCATETLPDSVVCTITGFCVQDRVFAEEEFLDTVAVDSAPVARVALVEYHDVLRHVHSVLCSDASRECLRLENERVSQKLAHMFRRVLREHKTRHPHLVPNIVHATASLVARAVGSRGSACASRGCSRGGGGGVSRGGDGHGGDTAASSRGFCTPQFDANHRDALASTAAAAATRLINTFSGFCPALVATARRHQMFVGILYLMRTGVVVRGTRVLHLIPALRDTLPPESALQTHFGVRCGAVTETENLVKMAARSLSRAQLAALGADALDAPPGSHPRN